jgi:hypothetical protein
MSPIPNLKLCVYIQNAKLPSPLSSIHSTCIFNHVTYTFNAIIYVHTTNLWQGKKVGGKKNTKPSL